MDYWIAGLLQIKELYKKCHIWKIQNGHFKILLLNFASKFYFKFKPINPLIH